MLDNRFDDVLWGFWKWLFKGGGVQFVRKCSTTRHTPLGPATFTYEVYRTKMVQQAREFLEGKTVTERLYYIVVETPEGNWGKGIKGMYKE